MNNSVSLHCIWAGGLVDFMSLQHELALRLCTAGVLGLPMQNQEICYSKWRIALGKSILDEFYQNLAYVCQTLFSADSTTFGATCNQFYMS